MKIERALVLGMAKSGLAAAKLLARRGVSVTVNDRKPRDQCMGIEDLEQMGINFVCGSHPLSLLDQHIDLIVKNPGIPYSIPLIQEAMKRQIPVITEVELGYFYTEAPIIGITGSNGKTTTTMLVYEILKESGDEALVAGNIGTVFCEVAAHAKPNQWLVTELSSFQLQGTHRFKPKIGTLLNIYDAHLDYHGSKEAYIQAKAKLFANHTAADIAVINADQEETKKIASRLPGQLVWFSRHQPVERGLYISGEELIYRDRNGVDTIICYRNEVKLLGIHNLENCMAAAATALEAGASPENVRKVLNRFQGVDHRLQWVAEVNGIQFYNDSKATNALATKRAIESFPTPVILIAGGLDRGDDYRELATIFHKHLKGLIVYGETAEKLAEVGQQAGVKAIIRVDNVKEAVKEAYRLANSGDTILLSPAAASWDQFASFEERGDMFIKSVHMLK